MSALPHQVSNVRTAELILDADRLSGLVGRPVRATRLRHKPGLSTVAALLPRQLGWFGAPGGSAGTSSDPIGWVQVCEPGHVDKVHNAERRADERGLELVVRELPDSGLWLLHGGLSTDARLARGLDDATRVLGPLDAALEEGTARLLRYNPLRRVVWRRESVDGGLHVVRVTADKEPNLRPLLSHLRQVGLPVVPPLGRGPEVPDSHRVRVSEWVGLGDLEWVGRDDPQALADGARQAGAALAQLHRTEVPDAVWTPHQAASDHRRLSAVQDTLQWWDPDLTHSAARLRREVLAALDQSGHGVVHGDFSADQVLVHTDGRITLIDFDRTGHGVLAQDLGTWAAAALTSEDASVDDLARLTDPTVPTSTAAMLAGYEQDGGPVPLDERMLRAWTARSLLLRATEPFRAGRREWRDEVRARLHQVREVLG